MTLVAPVGPMPTGLDSRGAELVELSEQLYVRLFGAGLRAGLVVTLFALALVPVRRTGTDVWTPLIVVGSGLGLIVGIRDERRLYWRLRRRPLSLLPIFLVLLVPFFLGQPANNPLWFVMIVLVGLTPVVVPLPVALGCALIAIAGQLLAYLPGGHVREITSLVLGAEIANLLVPLAMAAIIDTLAGLLLRLNAAAAVTAPGPLPPRRVHVLVEDFVAQPVRAEPPAPVAPTLRLTARQLQVVALLRDGLRYAEIAACLGITIHQVARLVGQAKARSGAATPSALVARAVAAGILPPR